MKILMSAYACEPGKGSEPAVGWNWALQASKKNEVWVVTRRNNRAAIEAAMALEPNPNLHFVYHDLPKRLLFWKRGPLGLQLYYIVWQLTALRMARRLHAREKFDLGHHVTFVSQRFPSFLAWMNLPFIWGPVAMERAPAVFYHTFGLRGVIQQRIRDVSNAVVRFDPLVRRTARKASLILAATPQSRAAVEEFFGRSSDVCVAIGGSGEATAVAPPAGPLKVIYVGNLLYLKAMHLGIEGFARAAENRQGMTLTIVGDGPERSRLEALAESLGVADAVTFTGKVPQARVMELLKEHNCLLFPSLQDSGGMVVLEAMAHRLPVVCLKIGGPALTVTEETGVPVPPHDPEQIIEEFAYWLLRLNDEPALRARMGDAGAERFRDFSWDRLEGLTDDLYRRCLSIDDSALPMGRSSTGKAVTA